MENTRDKAEGSGPESLEPGSPFESQPRDPAAFQGCSRPVLIGCGVTILVVALSTLLLVVKAKDLFLWAFDKSAEQIMLNLPSDLTDAEAERLRQALKGASESVVEGRIDIDGLQDLQTALALASQPSATRAEVLEAIEALERVASAPAPGSSAELDREGARLPRDPLELARAA